MPGAAGGGADFTSALYLGMRHPSRALPRWDRLTTGRPAALAAPPGEGAVARRLARLQGCEAGILFPSTLHLFWDLFRILAPGSAGIWVDRGAYPVARWGVERAAGSGTPLHPFRHHDPDALERALARRAPASGPPLVLADGFCPGCGRHAPLGEYLERVREHGGLLVVDDTQALGIYGAPHAGAPYGRGGGGSLRFREITGPDVLLGCSLAKGFGAPVAALSGPEVLVRRVEGRSETRTHCSPPSAPALLAAARALAVNQAEGEALRARLAERVSRLRRGLRRPGLRPVGGLFPVQTLHPPFTGPAADALHARLRAEGVQTVLHAGSGGVGARISFLVTAAHAASEIDRAVEVVAELARPHATRSDRCRIDASPKPCTRG